MKLEVGKYNNKELAEWFGIKPNSFSKNKGVKLEELKHFAEFYEENGKIVITKVMISEYSKKGSKAYQMIRDEIDKTWAEDGLDSCSRVSLEIGEKLKNELSITPSTLYNYTRKTRKEVYGIPFQKSGTLGSCKYLLCKKEGNGIDIKYSMFTAEEEKIKNDLVRKYFGDATEKQIIVQAMVETGEISKEEAWEVLTDLTGMKGNNFLMFLGELQGKLNCQVVRGTLVMRNQNFIEAGPDDFLLL